MAAALVCAGSVTQASPVTLGVTEGVESSPSSVFALSDRAAQSDPGVSLRFTLQSATPAPVASDGSDTHVLNVQPASRADRRAHGAESSDGTNRRTTFELLLWSFVRDIRAQQHDNRFELLESNIALFEYTVGADPIAAVPLPGAVWLFVMGALGLAGSRVTGLAGSRVTCTVPAGADRGERGAARVRPNALPA
jgi:hypothetical protein